jgi:hypothetical protein
MNVEIFGSDLASSQTRFPKSWIDHRHTKKLKIVCHFLAIYLVENDIAATSCLISDRFLSLLKFQLERTGKVFLKKTTGKRSKLITQCFLLQAALDSTRKETQLL